MAREISNHDDVIDSRDVIERIEELTEKETNEDVGNGTPGSADLSTYMTDEEVFELSALRALAEEGESLADWPHGEALIRDSYFTEYAQELAEDIGAIDRDVRWPYTSIDWEHAAWELRMDYTSVEFDGVTYWVRS